MKHLRDLASRWRAEAKRFRNLEAVGQAAVFEQVAHELEEAIVEEELEALTLEEAERESGLSYGHLSRLVVEGKIPNAGRKGSPRILRRDLPKSIRRAS